MRTISLAVWSAAVSAITGYHFTSWQWWAVVVPAIIIAHWGNGSGASHAR